MIGRHRRTRLGAKLAVWPLLWTLLAAAAVTPTAAIPSLEHCTVLELRLDEGWWLQIRRDRPAAYGFGALPQRVVVKPGTFSFEAFYRAVIDRVSASASGAPVTVIFAPMAAGQEGRVFALEDAGSYVTELFAAAYRERDESLDDGFQQQAIRSLEPFWAEAPFLQ